MTGFDEEPNREEKEVGKHNPRTFPFFFFPSFYLLCFVSLLPVIAAVALAVGKSSGKWARVK